MDVTVYPYDEAPIVLKDVRIQQKGDDLILTTDEDGRLPFNIDDVQEVRITGSNLTRR